MTFLWTQRQSGPGQALWYHSPELLPSAESTHPLAGSTPQTSGPKPLLFIYSRRKRKQMLEKDTLISTTAKNRDPSQFLPEPQGRPSPLSAFHSILMSRDPPTITCNASCRNSCKTIFCFTNWKLEDELFSQAHIYYYLWAAQTPINIRAHTYTVTHLYTNRNSLPNLSRQI